MNRDAGVQVYGFCQKAMPFMAFWEGLMEKKREVNDWSCCRGAVGWWLRASAGEWEWRAAAKRSPRSCPGKHVPLSTFLFPR
jgi:hypothetical protein